ncbi:MAG TPA: TraR/DksA C4-type zinc finger protein [Actinomycetota bacterium]|jgi:DnaK suppressor protein|nr:TraR/DksA C4-type zinc finger protein [Actinomycetota bacterium]
MDQQRLEAIRAELEEIKASVERQLAEHGAPVGGDNIDLDVNEGFADSAQATTERAQLISLIEQLRTQHADVTKALRRLDDGTYGKCERCGQEIPIERLEAIPTASLCVSCKQAG